MAEYLVQEKSLKDVADAIRTKLAEVDSSNEPALLTFPNDFITAIESINTSTNTPGYANKDIFPTQDVTWADGEHYVGVSCVFNFVNGETYFVEWDGEFYVCEALLDDASGQIRLQVDDRFAIYGGAYSGIDRWDGISGGTVTVRIYQIVPALFAVTINGARYGAIMTWGDFIEAYNNEFGQVFSFAPNNKVLYGDSMSFITKPGDPNNHITKNDFIENCEYVLVSSATPDDPISEITFTVDNVAYKALEGMTWGEWVSSDYNTAGATIMDDGRVLLPPIVATDYGTGYQYSTEVIVAGKAYVTSA